MLRNVSQVLTSTREISVLGCSQGRCLCLRVRSSYPSLPCPMLTLGWLCLPSPSRGRCQPLIMRRFGLPPWFYAWIFFYGTYMFWILWVEFHNTRGDPGVIRMIYGKDLQTLGCSVRNPGGPNSQQFSGRQYPLSAEAERGQHIKCLEKQCSAIT